MQKRVLSCRGLFVAAAIMTLVFSTSVLAERPSTVLGGGSSSTSAAAEKKHPGPQFYDRTNYVWPYAAGPYYGPTRISEVERSKSGMFITAVGAIDVSLGAPSFPQELTTPDLLSRDGSQFFVLVADPSALKSGDFGADLETLRSLGGEVVEEMPVASFLVRLNPQAHASLSGNPDIVALFPYHAAFKIDPSVGRVPLIDEQEATSELYRLRVSTFPGANLDELKQQIIALGSTSVQLRSGSSLVFYLHRSKLAALAQLQSVKQIVEDVPLLIHGEETTATMQAGTCGSASSPCLSPFHDADIIGNGRATCTGGANAGALCQRNSDCASDVCTRTVQPQTIAVLDSGVQLDAADLSDTFTLPGTINDPNHRKVIVYESAAQFGGEGDLLGCDSPLSGGSTHGHVVAAVAAGNATDTFPGYGGTSFLFTPPPDRNAWKVDGVAPGAKLVVYDAQKTPAAGGSLCGSEILIGDLYVAGGGVDSALEGAYSEGARVINMSFGTAGSNPAVYSAALSGAVDLFLVDNRDAMTFASAGNAGGDSNMNGVPDQLNVGEPAVAKNGVAVGASLNTGSGVNTRAGYSSTGPATDVSDRVAPILMAPGSDSLAGPGLWDPYACRTNTNPSTGTVVCLADEQIVIEEGTSFSAPSVAGAAALVRDYFAQGFYPDGVRKTSREEPVISGALVKAILIASAEFMTNIGIGGTLTEGGRFNYEQGYGRPELDNALPLQSWPPSPSGLVVTDGSVKVCDNAPTTKCTSSANCGGQPCNIPISNTSLTGGIGQGTTQTYTFKVEDNTQPLSIALVWIDPTTGVPATSDVLQNDIDLSLTSPSGKVFKGNFFSEDVDLDDVLDTDAAAPDVNVENCINGYDGDEAPGLIDEGAFSIATNSCGLIDPGAAGGGDVVDRFDHKNPTEAIYLSHDANGDSALCFAENRCPPGGNDPDTPGIDESDDNQIEVGSWTLRIIAETTFAVGTGQDYSIALVGPVSARSAVRFDDFEYVCNDLATITVNETDPTADGDTHLSACGTEECREGEVESRTTVTVVDPTNTVVDSETGTIIDFQQSGAPLSFVSGNNLVTDATLRSASSTYGNGVLDVRSGDTIRVQYADEVGGATNADLLRENQSAAVCKVKLRFGGVNFGQFGQNQATLIEGGCERDARGKFTFGRPDRYMDSGEHLGYRIAFTSAETDVTLDNVELSLRCVIADTDSPKTCQPGTTQCTDPDRLNNTACTQMTIVDSPKFVEALPPGAVLAANFAIVMNTFGGTPDVDMMLGVTAETAGKTVQNFIASRHKLNRDEKSLFYSTDFPQGGTETVDWNNDEVIAPAGTCMAGTPCLETARGEPTTDVNFTDDYRFETWVWSSLEANSQNNFLQAPWNFDSNNGGFSVVLMADSDTELIAAGGAPAQWGEDFNGNGLLDKVCSGTQGGVLACTANAQCGRCASFGLCQRNSNQQILDIGCPLGCSGTACGCGGAAFTCIPMSCGANSDCARIGGGNCNLDNGIDTCINGSEDRDSLNTVLDSGWSTRGGCGWQSKPAAAATGGIWHTGRIDFTTLTNCGTLGDLSGQCQLYETIGTTVSNDKRLWFELLKTPIMFKVNQGLSGGEPIYTSEHLQWAWNLAMDINDRTAGFSWELDLDTNDIVSSNLDRLPVFNALFGEHGPRSGGNSPLTDGYLAFAPAHVCNNSLDGTPVACGTDEECDDLLLSGTCSVAATNVCSRAPNIACTNTTPDVAPGPQEKDAACSGVCNAPSCNDGGVEANCTCDTDFDCVGANGGPGNGPDPDGAGMGLPALPPLCNKQGPTGRGGVGPCVSSMKCTQSFYPCTTDDECRCVQNPGAGGNGGVGTRGDTVNGTSAAITPLAGVCQFETTTNCDDNGDCGTKGPCVLTRGNRAGRNSCFFEEPGAVVIPFNLPQPPDDDENNDRHCENDPAGSRNFCRVDNDCGACQNSNSNCTGAGVPNACCTGNGTGTCNLFCRVNDDCGSCANNALIPCQNQSDCASVGGSCNFAGASTDCTLGAAGTACLGAADGTDEYVYPNPTIRTWDLSQVNGQDMRLGTLEDIYGDSGNSFQGGLGMLTFQGTGNVLEPGAGYGLGVDDMVVQWREYLLEQDETDCTPVSSVDFDSGGTCASIELDTTQLYVGGAVLGVSIVDPFPYDSVPGGLPPSENYNDCNNDSDYTDNGRCNAGPGTCTVGGAVCTVSPDDCAANTGPCLGAVCDPDSVDALPDPCQPSNGFCAGADDRDCNNNGTVDIVATGTSTSLDLEILVLDLISPGVYRTQFPVSVTYDVPGTLFLASLGAANPEAIVRYTDRDDGTGATCPNSTDVTTEGIVDASTFVGITQGDVIVIGSSLTDALRADCDGMPGGGDVACGDGDTFPDTNEILNLRLDVTNKSSVDYEDVVVRILSTSPNIDCILQPMAVLGTLPKRGTAGKCDDNTTTCTSPSPTCNGIGDGSCNGAATAFGVGPFVFKVANLSRTSTTQDFSSTIKVLISSKDFNALVRPQEVLFEMDLNASGGGGSLPFTQGFEASLGQFTPDTDDHLTANNEGSDGWRCQYNDPDNPQANSLDNPNCFLGFAGITASNFWHRHTTSFADGGKGHTSNTSMHFGKHSGGVTANDTEPLKQVDSAVSTAVHLGFGSPKLEFWHIVSLMDYRGSNTPAPYSIDAAVVQVQRMDGATPIGNWIKIPPYQNVYDVQRTDIFSNCSFDPVNDGNNEDTKFDPTDPQEIHGPASTCNPEFNFVALGDSHPTRGFNALLTGRASDPDPAFIGPSGGGQGGTWVQSRFDLSRFRGRSIRFRFLATTSEIEDNQDWVDAGFAAGSLIDDGWYVDDVLIQEALSSAPTLAIDAATNTAFPGCGAGCISVTPDLQVNPPTATTTGVGPGQTVELNAAASTANQCADGTIHFRFWEDLDASLTFSAGDTLIRNFTDNPIVVVAPNVSTTYGVDVICTSNPSCPPTDAVIAVDVVVNCPQAGNPPVFVISGLFGVPPASPPGLTINGALVSPGVKRIQWIGARLVDAVRGDLIALRSSNGNFTTSILACQRENIQIQFIQPTPDPTVGNAFFYLVRDEDATFCNHVGTYSTETSQEVAGRDTEINLAGSACTE